MIVIIPAKRPPTGNSFIGIHSVRIRISSPLKKNEGLFCTHGHDLFFFHPRSGPKKRAILSTVKGREMGKDPGHILPIQAGITGFFPAVDTRTRFFCSSRSFMRKRCPLRAFFPAWEMKTPVRRHPSHSCDCFLLDTIFPDNQAVFFHYPAYSMDKGFFLNSEVITGMI